MNTRIKLLRKELKKTQDEFSSAIGLSRNFIAQIEIGTKIPSDRTISDICRVYNVNEAWLRTGEGEMFLPRDREAEIAKLTVELLTEESDSFKNRLITALSRLSVEQWELLEEIAESMIKKE